MLQQKTEGSLTNQNVYTVSKMKNIYFVLGALAAFFTFINKGRKKVTVSDSYISEHMDWFEEAPKISECFRHNKTNNTKVRVLFTQQKQAAMSEGCTKKAHNNKSCLRREGYGSQLLLEEMFGTPGSRIRVPIIGS